MYKATQSKMYDVILILFLDLRIRVIRKGSNCLRSLII